MAISSLLRPALLGAGLSLTASVALAQPAPASKPHSDTVDPWQEEDEPPPAKPAKGAPRKASKAGQAAGGKAPAPGEAKATGKAGPQGKAGAQGKAAATGARPRKAVAKARGKGGEAPVNRSGPAVAAPSFRMLEDGGSRVFVEVSQKVEVSERKEQGRLVYALKGAHIAAANGGRALLTSFFATPVAEVALAEQGDGTDVVITLRAPVTPEHRLLDTPRGVVLQVDFPPGAPPPSGITRLPEAPEPAPSE